MHSTTRTALLAALLLPAAAAADTLDSEVEIREVSHQISARLRRPDLAELTVRRTYSNPEARTGVVVVQVDLPPSAVVVDMRSRSRRTWHRARLLPAADAERLFWHDDVSTILGDPALLAWLHPQLVELSTEVPAGGTTVVEYTLLIPAERDDGRSHISYAANDPQGVAPPVLRAASPSDRLWINDAPIPAGSHHVLIKGTADIAFASGPRRLAVHHGRALFAGGASSVTRVHIDAPTRLSATPDHLHVVFVLDASRSMSDAGVEAQLDIAAAYLAAAPTARFELVRFDRRARRLLGRFAGAGELAAIRARLEQQGALVTANGSHLDRGVEVAVAALRGRRTPRIVLLSDGVMRTGFSSATTIATLRRRAPRAIAHFITPTAGLGQPDALDDGHALAPIAAATGGTSLQVDASEDLGRTARHLIRPIRIDALSVSGPLAKTRSIPDELYEGDGLRLESVFEKASPDTVEVSGKLWARALTRRVKAGRAEGDLAAALVFGSDSLHAIPEAEVVALAIRGHAVSAATSLLVPRPGRRDDPSPGGVGYGTLCGGCLGGLIGHGSGTGTRPPVPAITLAGPLRRCAEKLGVAIDARVTLEVDRVEIVDVEVTADDPAARRCLTEAIWAHRLRDDQASTALQTLSIPLSSAALP